MWILLRVGIAAYAWGGRDWSLGLEVVRVFVKGFGLFGALGL